jgi:GNAT superfamily N-acetyltransferase
MSPLLSVMPVHSASTTSPQTPCAPSPADTGGCELLALRDGATVQVRAIQPDDLERLRAFHRRLTPDTVIFRFFHYMPELTAEDAWRFTHLDYENRMALVATAPVGDVEAIHAVVRYERTGSTEAEVAFVVEDAWQGRGIATALLHRLAAYARAHGISTFVAVTMVGNVRMLDVFRHAGFPCALRFARGEIAVTLDISASANLPL